ncbi:transcriptional regulator [Alphaproteobacteria bacterium]|nr:transcriptional regulator [Alphaproteobacteria bacterium]
MNKHDAVRAVAEKADISIKDASKFLNSFVKVAIKTMAKGEEVTLVGFGSFLRVERSARTGRDFKTGKNMDVPAYKTVRFKPGKGLKDAVI